MKVRARRRHVDPDELITQVEQGVATLTLPPGDAFVHAESKGLVRSFVERIEVR